MSTHGRCVLLPNNSARAMALCGNLDGDSLVSCKIRTGSITHVNGPRTGVSDARCFSCSSGVPPDTAPSRLIATPGGRSCRRLILSGGVTTRSTSDRCWVKWGCNSSSIYVGCLAILTILRTSATCCQREVSSAATSAACRRCFLYLS